MAVASLCKSFSSKLHFMSRVSSCIRLRESNHKTELQNLQNGTLQICHIWAGPTYTNSKVHEQMSLRNKKPKYPPNVFLVYLQKVQDQIQKDHPNASRKEVVAIASQQWKSVDPEEKSHLAMQRKDLFEKYKDDMKSYLENMTPEEMKLEGRRKQQKMTKKLKRARRELGMPKMPASAFCCFMTEHYSEHAGEDKVTRIFKRLRDQWDSLSDAEKEKYQKQSAQRSEVYKEEIERWEKDMMEMGRFDVIRKSTLLRLAMGNNPKKSKKDIEEL
ncbi:hypothetical protein RRG08_064576 [Elysia crispata]|uniref:HMG box domain-containing protein n=1 Tax=Elysia crispata TaxID=231223 RepID=A0AAE1B9D3_9GAST|nr:hypothetical protein RRG08_064576 [Elysia crispata]